MVLHDCSTCGRTHGALGSVVGAVVACTHAKLLLHLQGADATLRSQNRQQVAGRQGQSGGRAAAPAAGRWDRLQVAGRAFWPMPVMLQRLFRGASDSVTESRKMGSGAQTASGLAYKAGRPSVAAAWRPMWPASSWHQARPGRPQDHTLPRKSSLSPGPSPAPVRLDPVLDWYPCAGLVSMLRPTPNSRHPCLLPLHEPVRQGRQQPLPG